MSRVLLQQSYTWMVLDMFNMHTKFSTGKLFRDTIQRLAGNF